MTADSLTIRFAEPPDARSMALMSREYIEYGLEWKYDTKRILRAIGARETVCIVADGRDRLGAFAIMDFGEERAHLALLAVRPELRRRGIARRLVEWLLDSARTAGVESVHLELRTDNHAARAFYRRLGFSPTVVVPGYYQGRESALKMIRMMRTPGPLPAQWQPPPADPR